MYVGQISSRCSIFSAFFLPFNFLDKLNKLEERKKSYIFIAAIFMINKYTYKIYSLEPRTFCLKSSVNLLYVIKSVTVHFTNL